MNGAIRSQCLAFLQSHFFLGGVLLLSCGIGFSQSPPHPPAVAGPAMISVNTELVVLPVRVTDSRGSFVSGLMEQDFRIYENKRPQRLTIFHQEDSPVTVGLIVDHSRSMASKLPDVAAAVSAFAHSSNPLDEMFVVDFNNLVSLELPGGKPFTSNPTELDKAVAAVSASGQTALYDAVAEGLHHLRLAHWDKKALIIVSDGGDNASHLKYAQVLALARRSQVQIYSIGLFGSNEDEDPDVLQRLSKDTGGVAYFPLLTVSILDISKQIARDLREQYTIGFVPDNPTVSDSFRKIEVKASAPGRGTLHARTRPGYFAELEKGSPAQTGKGPS